MLVTLVKTLAKPINANSNTARKNNAVKATVNGNFVSIAPSRAVKARTFAFAA